MVESRPKTGDAVRRRHKPSVFGPAALVAPGAGRRRFDCGRQGTTRVLG